MYEPHRSNLDVCIRHVSSLRLLCELHVHAGAGKSYLQSVRLPCCDVVGTFFATWCNGLFRYAGAGMQRGAVDSEEISLANPMILKLSSGMREMTSYLSIGYRTIP